jgi:hypothetical protein
MQRSTKELLKQDPFQKFPMGMFAKKKKKKKTKDKKKKHYLPAKYQLLKEKRQVTT